MLRTIVVAAWACAALAACTAPQAQPPAPAPPPPASVAGTVTCTAPRPQMCTRDYRPVCGTRSDGTRQTYGNGCGACADAAVVSHRPGPC